MMLDAMPCVILYVEHVKNKVVADGAQQQEYTDLLHV